MKFVSVEEAIACTEKDLLLILQIAPIKSCNLEKTWNLKIVPLS